MPTNSVFEYSFCKITSNICAIGTVSTLHSCFALGVVLPYAFFMHEFCPSKCGFVAGLFCLADGDFALSKIFLGMQTAGGIDSHII